MRFIATNEDRKIVVFHIPAMRFSVIVPQYTVSNNDDSEILYRIRIPLYEKMWFQKAKWRYLLSKKGFPFYYVTYRFMYFAFYFGWKMWEEGVEMLNIHFEYKKASFEFWKATWKFCHFLLNANQPEPHDVSHLAVKRFFLRFFVGKCWKLYSI